MKYLPSYDLCVTDMLRNHFDDIWYAVRWSRQPPEQPDGMSLEQYHWMLVDNFIANINEYRSRPFNPGNHLGADETVIWWYGLGGAFVDAGLPIYLVLECKPNNGGEIQNLAAIASGIMLHLKVVKSVTQEKVITATTATATADNNVAASKGEKGMQVLLEMTESWHHRNHLSPPGHTLHLSRRH